MNFESIKVSEIMQTPKHKCMISLLLSTMKMEIHRNKRTEIIRVLEEEGSGLLDKSFCLELKKFWKLTMIMVAQHQYYNIHNAIELYTLNG